MFIADLVRWTPLTIKDFYFIDQFCTMDGSLFCWNELQAISAMPDGDAKTTRICSSSCYQRILIKAILFEATNGTIDVNAVKTLVMLNDICATGPTGAYCFDEFSTIGTTVNQAAAAGCNWLTGACPASCNTLATNLINTEGCCMNNFQQIAAISGNATLIIELGIIVNFIQTKCMVSIPPACPRSDRNVTVEIVLENLAWAAYQANVDVVRAAVIRDLAAVFGVLEAEILFQQDFQTQSSMFALFSVDANSGASLSFTVSPQSNTAASSGSATFNQQVSDGTMVTPNIQSLNPAMRNDPGSPIGVAPNSMAGSAVRVAASLTTLLFAIATALFSTRV